MPGQFRLTDPFDPCAIKRLRLTRHQTACEKSQVNTPVRIVMADFLKQAPDHDFNSQFLTKLTDQAPLEAFARFTFASGKFPQPALVRIGVALGDKQLAIAKDERSGNLNTFTIDD